MKKTFYVASIFAAALFCTACESVAVASSTIPWGTVFSATWSYIKNCFADKTAAENAESKTSETAEK